MNWLTAQEMAKEPARAAARKLRHDQGGCSQHPQRCGYCWQEAQDAKTGGPEYEAALHAYFGGAS